MTYFSSSPLLIGVQISSCGFFLEIWVFIVKNRLQCNHSKYCPSMAPTFSHLSGNLRIPSQKNDVGFDAIHESTDFSVSS